jgi:hypothetical protein
MTVKIDIVSEYKDKGAKAAEKSMAKLSKSAKNLAVALGVGFSINKIVQFGKASVKEFEDSEIAATKLQNVLKNTGQLLAFPDTITGLNNLSKLSGVADDLLIPAFQQLYLATGNANQAVKDLDLAINVARGSSNDLGTVVDALSKGYAGNTKGLASLQVGLNKAYLATGDMAGITQQLNKQFTGASAAYLDTYAGKIQLLRNDFENLKQTVGQGLIMAAQAATGNQGIGGVSKAMENLGYFTAAATIAVGNLINKLNSIPLVGGLLDRVVQGWSYLLNVDEVRQEIRNQELRQNTKLIEQAYAQAEIQKKAAKEYQAFLAKQKKLADAAAKKEADQAKLKKANTVFDLDRIQVMAALQGKISEEEKTRLQLQMALLTDNADEAKRLSEKLIESQLRTTNLALAISSLPKALNPFADWPRYIQELAAMMAGLKLAIPTLPNQTGPSKYDTIQSNLTTEFISLGIESGAAQGLAASSARLQAQADAYFKANPNIDPMTGKDITVNVQIGNQQITDYVTNTQVNNSASGISTKVNRLSLID